MLETLKTITVMQNKCNTINCTQVLKALSSSIRQ